jgi:hypothetical protein
MTDRIEALIPLSARAALRARRSGDETALAASGLPALLEALEERFFREARSLKRNTALQALARFSTEAAALAPPPADMDGEIAQRHRELATREQALRGAVAAERVGLRGRLDEAFRQAAIDVLEFLRPRRWPFGERRAEAADEEFLFDLLEDAVEQATGATCRALETASEGLQVPIAATIEHYRAFARGVLVGGAVHDFLREDLASAGGRTDASLLQRALARRIPDVEPELFGPLDVALTAALARARQTLDDERAAATMRRLIRDERLDRPLVALAAEARALA